MKKNVVIAVKEPRRKWVIQTVEDILPAYQHIVGGYIEHVYTTKEGIQIFGNEEGLIRQMPLNIILSEQFLFGTLFAVRSDEEGEFQSLTEEDFEALRLYEAGNEK